MSRIECEIEYSSDTNDEGWDTECVIAYCPKCNHQTMSWGTSEGSVKRCMVMLNQECPNKENNYYVAEPGSLL